MKIKFLHTIVSLLCASFLITSCLDNDYEEVEYSSESSITAFSIDDIITEFKDSITFGKDTLLTDTVLGYQYPFVIDQGRKLIYNVDSLPVGTDISKVLAKIQFDGIGLFIEAGEQDTLWADTDSLNFEKPIQFKAMAMSGVYGSTYTAKINVHQQEPDSLSWTRVGNCFSSDIKIEKALTLGDSIYVLAHHKGNVIKEVVSIHGESNYLIVSDTNLPDNADCSSAMVWGDEFLILAGSDLYRSSDAQHWQKVETEAKFSRLLANVHTTHNNKVYAINSENRFMESADGIVWEVKEEVPASFPQSPTAFAVSPLASNSHIERLTVMGNNAHANDSAAIVWSKLTTEATWGDYALSADSKKYCPAMENLGMVYYNNLFYAFGGPVGEQKAFHRFYTSTDKGVSWQPVKKWMFFPEEFAELYAESAGNYSYVVDKNNYLWFIFSKNGECWKARINKMGFADYE